MESVPTSSSILLQQAIFLPLKEKLRVFWGQEVVIVALDRLYVTHLNKQGRDDITQK